VAPSSGTPCHHCQCAWECSRIAGLLGRRLGRWGCGFRSPTRWSCLDEDGESAFLLSGYVMGEDGLLQSLQVVFLHMVAALRNVFEYGSLRVMRSSEDCCLPEISQLLKGSTRSEFTASWMVGLDDEAPLSPLRRLQG
jgi:hypothetical protein